MTIPGVGRLTALAFGAAIDIPDRFRRLQSCLRPLIASVLPADHDEVRGADPNQNCALALAP